MTAPGGATDKVSVVIAGNAAPLDDAMKQAAGAVTKMKNSVTRDLEEVGVISESVGKRMEHFGISASFAISSLAEGATTGVTRSAHALAALGFAFGTTTGGIATALAIATERMIEFTHRAQEAADKAREAVEQSAEALRRTGDGIALLTQARLAQGDLDEANAAQKRAADAYAISKKNLDDLHVSVGRGSPIYRRAKNDEIERWQEVQKTTAAVKAAQAALETYTTAISNLRNAAPDKNQLGTTTSSTSDDERVKAGKKALEQYLKDQAHYADVFTKIWQDHFDGVAKFDQLGRDTQTKAAEKQADEWKQIVKNADDDIAKFRDERAAQYEKDQKARLDSLEKGWLSVFGAIQTAFEQTVQGLVQGTLTMRQAWSNLARSLVLDSLAAFAKIQEARAAHWLAAQGLDAGALAKSAALHAFDAVRFIAVEAAKAAAAAWTWATVTLGPWLAPAVAAATLVGVLALAGSLGGGGGGSSSGGAGGSAPAGGGGNSSTTIYNISAIDSQSFHQALMRNSPSVAAATMAGSARGVRIPTTPGRGA